MAGPTLRPGPGPWRYGQRRTQATVGATRKQSVIVRATVVTPWGKRFPAADAIVYNFALLNQPPAATGPTPAGRHHKRYKVFLGGRAVYFATRAEAENARETHRAGLIVEAQAAGVDPRKIKIRRAPIRLVSVDGRHPADLAPAVQMAALPHPEGAEILAAVREAQMREEEEIAIALLLAR